MASQKTIAVTGASRGIGAAIALELARRGFSVACLSRKGKGIETGGIPPAAAPRLIAQACDVTDEKSIAQAFAAIVAKTGALHGLVNNAGIHLSAPSHELTTQMYEEVMHANATSVFLASRAAYPHIVGAGGGLIVNIGSFYEKLGVKRNLAYCASKAAVGAITRCLAVEWASKGIRVMDVAPGYIETDLNRDALKEGPLHDFLVKRIPGGKTGTAHDVGKLVGALYAEDIPFLSGETIYIDGAQGVAH
jgi:NAD(P)-dependent dehydrogenase (short-subunit alcohol dehydrogenase family)